MIERQTLQTPRGTFFFQSTFTNECLKDIKKDEKMLKTCIEIFIKSMDLSPLCPYNICLRELTKK